MAQLDDCRLRDFAECMPLGLGEYKHHTGLYRWLLQDTTIISDTFHESLALSSTIVKPRLKRAAAIGIANTCANIASLFANYFWLDKYEPYFRESWSCLLAFQLLGMACILSLRYSLKRANRRFEKLTAEVSDRDTAAVTQLTEEEQRAVLYGYRFIT